jgi:hypothetical protein
MDTKMISINEYKSILEDNEYSLDSTFLKELTKKLPLGESDYDRYGILFRLKNRLSSNRNYQFSIEKEETVLHVSLHEYWASLQFSINDQHQLILVQENYYDSTGGGSEEYEIIIGKPTIENVIKTIELFVNLGNARRFRNLDMSYLIGDNSEKFE